MTLFFTITINDSEVEDIEKADLHDTTDTSRHLGVDWTHPYIFKKGKGAQIT